MYFWTWNLHYSVSYIYFIKMTTHVSVFYREKRFRCFFTVKFSLTKTLQLGNKFFLKFFLLIRAFFACFLFIKRNIVSFELFFDTPTWWQASISFADTFVSLLFYSTFTSFKISTSFSSKFWSGTLSGILYCSSELCSLSRLKILFLRTFTLLLRRSFST